MGVTGLLGGSFDPIHNGHLQLARDALKQLTLDELRFIPAAQPWQKDSLHAPAEHRAQMVQLAIADEPRCTLDMHEIERGGVTYTIDTLRALRSSLPRRALVLIMGSDQFARLDTWRDWKENLRTVHIAVAQRARNALIPGLNLQAVLDNHRCDAAGLALQPGGNVVEFAMTPVDVSATEVRGLLRLTQSGKQADRLSAMVPRPVLDYISKHHLYKE